MCLCCLFGSEGRDKRKFVDMRVLSLFDGKGCGYIALKELGVNIETYYASEVDKYAIKMSSHLNPGVIHLGDVCNIDVSKLEPIDLLMGGSPCQSFSFAGKRKGMATKCSVEIYTLDKYLELKGSGFEFEGQSYLFWEYMRILTDIRKYNPDVKFLLENVEMGKKWERILSEAVGVYGVHINSALVSAQSRKRIYWSNIRTKLVGIFGDLYTDIPQPTDRGILLRDILESDVPDKYYLSDKMLNYFDSRAANFNNGKVNIRNHEDKATTLTASMASCDISDNFVLDTKLQVKANQDKANCFTAGGNSGGLHSDMDLICVASRGRQDESGRWIQEYEPNNTGKTNTITSVQKDNLVMQLNPSTESGGKQPYQQNMIYDTNGISPALCANKSDLLILGCDYRTDEGFRIRENGKSGTLAARARNDESCGQLVLTIPEATKQGYTEIKPGECFDFENPNSQTRRGRKMEDKSNCLMANETKFMQLTHDYRIRRLTPKECLRLQTVPEPVIDKMLSSGISDTQIYKMAGNGWTIEVIKFILSHNNF